MSYTVKRFLVWAPRILGILFTLFVAAFALDVFDSPAIFSQTLFVFIGHLIPALILVILLLIAWRWDWVGTILFIGYGVLYLTQSQADFPLSVYLIMAGVPFLTGLLFFASWIWKSRPPKSTARVSRL